jgi:SAM-dependent methyltransferase
MSGIRLLHIEAVRRFSNPVGGAVAALLLTTVLSGMPVAATGQALSEREAAMFTAGEGYERFMGRWSRRLAVQFVDFSEVKDGNRMLDVGSGTGALTTALTKAAPSSEISGIDPSEGFVTYARKALPSTRVQFEVGDAQSMRFPDATFDRTMALLVMNFVPDHSKAIGEMRRVTRPGGIVSACVWDYDAGMEMLRFFWDEVVALDPAMAAKDERNMKLSRSGQLGELWRTAGLANVTEAPITIEQPFASFNDYWEPFLKGAGPGGAYVVSLSAERRAQLEARLRQRLLQNRQDGDFVLKARAWCVRGEA